MIEASLGTLATDRKWKAAVVLQGPYSPKHTPQVVKIFLERNDTRVAVIVSTYLPPEEKNGDVFIGSFLSYFEKSVVEENSLSPYAGRLIYLFVITPTPESSPDFWRTNYINQNRQRVTSFAGLQYAVEELHVKYALKCRCDAFLGRTNVCDFLIDSLETNLPPLIPEGMTFDCNKIRSRIIVSDLGRILEENRHWTRVGNYYIADYWLFGNTQDLLSYFDMRPGTAWENGTGITTKFDVETNLALVWMRNVGISSNIIKDYADLSARFLIVVDMEEVEFVWLKTFHDYHRYLREGKHYLRNFIERFQRSWRLVRGNRWRGFVEQVIRCEGNSRSVKDVKE